MEKAKAFFLICAGVLMLAVAMDIGTEKARADFDPDAGGPVVGFDRHGAVLLDNGECWAASLEGWVRMQDNDPPIPLSDLAFWSPINLLATNGDWWYWNSGDWVNLGTPPESTPARSSNWSQLKSNFGK